MAENRVINDIKYVIDRYDNYFDSINNKSQFYLAINTLILSGLVVGLPMLKDNCKITGVLLILIILFCLACISSLIFTMLAIKPFLKNGHSEDGYKSLIFFDSVASLNRNDFAEKFSATQNLQTDLLYQAHQLAKGLSYKYKKMKWAAWLLLVDVVILILITLLILNNTLS